MTGLKYLLVFFFLFNVHVLREVHGAGELDNFIKKIISEYGDYLQTGNHDPSRTIENVMDIGDWNDFITVSCELSKYFAVGHSRDITILHDYVRSDLPQGYLEFEVVYGANLTFKGDYKGSATVGQNSFSGEGNWFISFDAGYHATQFRSFNVTSDGFLDFSAATFYNYMETYPDTTMTSYFEGLFDDVESEYKDTLKGMLEKKFVAQLSFDNNPLARLIMSYVYERLVSTPLSEIIDTPPPTTTSA